jgi:ketosteroid isomerase-like protein
LTPSSPNPSSACSAACKRAAGRDWDALWEICAEDVVWRLIGGFADLGGAAFQGRDALRWPTDWIETIEGRTEIEQFETVLEAGGAGSASGAPATIRSGLVFSFRDGQISAVDSYYEASEALEAVGLSSRQGKLIYLRAFRDPEQALGAVGLTENEGRLPDQLLVVHRVS